MCDFVKSLYNTAQIEISAFFFSGMFYLPINFIPLSSFYSNTEEKVQSFPAPLPPQAQPPRLSTPTPVRAFVTTGKATSTHRVPPSPWLTLGVVCSAARDERVKTWTHHDDTTQSGFEALKTPCAP